MRRHTILLVDDEDAVIHALVRLLRTEPYDLLTAAGGAQALEVIQQRPIDLVLTDYRMPEMNGVELLKQIRQRYPDAMRIILSGYADVAATLEAINIGEVYRFITKPWANEDLKLVLRQALEHYDLMQDNKLLLRMVHRQADLLRQVETKYPGIAKVTTTADGAYVLGSASDDPTLEEFLKRYFPKGASS